MGNRVSLGDGVAVLYSITPTLHTRIIQEALPYKSGTKPYKKKKVSQRASIEVLYIHYKSRNRLGLLDGFFTPLTLMDGQRAVTSLGIEPRLPELQSGTLPTELRCPDYLYLKSLKLYTTAFTPIVYVLNDSIQN